MLLNKLVVSAFLVGFLLAGCNNHEQSYIQYKPVYANYYAKNKSDMYIVSDEKITRKHTDNLLIVLSYYNVSHIEKNGNIYLPLDVWEDKDIIMNYTKKANDPEWIRKRKADGKKEFR